MITDYQSRKKEVLASYDMVEKLVADIQAYSKKINLPDPTIQVSALLSDIRDKAAKVKEDRFNIMIAGEAKSGKSTFINAYLGVELLPMDVKQCTSSIVEIKYGDTFSVRATYADGRQTLISNEDKARDFLKRNAALDDDYRDIPVPTINSEILVKSGLRARAKGKPISISKAEVEAMLKAPEVQEANIHNRKDYNDRIRAYIKARKDHWQDIVTKIEVMFPFDDDLRGIEIIDSPGVCARGGVAEITAQYIENADAIIFLKPLSGQALESTQFNQFMKNASVARNKNALFLVLTRAADVTESDLHRLEEEAYKQFSKLNRRNILIVDSKAELYAQKFANVESIDDIKTELRHLNDAGTLDDFVVTAFSKTSGLFGSGTAQDFVTKLKEISRFTQIDESLNTFGRKAHYLLLSALLDAICNVYIKLWHDTNSRIEMFQRKAEDPVKLAKKIAEVKADLDRIQNKMYRGVDKVTSRFLGDNGIIQQTAETTPKEFLKDVEKINPSSNTAFQDLENASLKRIDQFKDLTLKLQHQVVEECDKELIALSSKESIPFESLQPNFTDATFKKIKDSTKSKAYETHSYETGTTFKETHTYSEYVQNKHFIIVKNNIVNRLETLKKDLVENLSDFVENIRGQYIVELSKNAERKKEELDAIMEAKATAEQSIIIVKELSVKANQFKDAQTRVQKIKGGILKHVQHNA